MRYKIAQLIVNPEQSDSISQIFISQPGLEEENLLGRLFILVESKKKKADISKLIEFIATQLEHNYYQNDKIMLMERMASVKIEDIFESSITKLNQNIVTFLQSEKIKFIPEDISITVGVVYKSKLHFTNIGRNKALLIYKPKSKVANQDTEYDLIDITKKTNDPTQSIFSINKLFNNIVNGSIPNGGYFMFTNEALSEYLSEKQLMKIVTTLPPASAVEQIKNILTKTNIFVPFLGLLFKSTKAGQEFITQRTAPVKLKRDKDEELKPQSEKVIPKNDQTKTINTLNATEEQTADILNPSGLINVRKIKKVLNTEKFKNKFKNSKKKKILLLKNNISGRRTSRFNWEKIKSNLIIIQKIFTIVFNFVIIFFKAITSKKNWSNAKGKIINVTQKTKGMSKRNKIVLSIIIVCALSLVGNLLYNNIKKQKEAELQVYLGAIEILEQKQGQIEADLIYDNRNGARATLQEVKKLLIAFPQETEEEQAKFVELNNKYQKQLDSISNVKRIEDPVVYKIFENNISPNNLTLLNDKIYLTDNTSKTIYTIESDKTISSNSFNGLDNIANLTQPITDEKESIYYLDNNQIVEYNINGNKLERLKISLPPTTISTLTVYNNKFYLFDKNENQIYRYNKYNNSLANKVGWLKNTDSSVNLKSISIDGYLYAINNNTINKYGGGRKQEFELDNIEPTMINPTKLLVTIDLELMYVLEPTNNRLIVFNKNGKFLTQYTSDKFNNLIDFVIDEANNKIYVLNDKVVYELDLFKE